MRLIFITLLFLFSTAIFAQTREDKKLLREQRKLEKQQQEIVMTQLVESMIHSKRFVLEADKIRDRYGNSSFVQSTLNFISVDSNDAVIQLGTPSGLGYNGVGGITVEGQLTKYEIDYRAKSDSYTLEIGVSSAIGVYDIVLFISSSGHAEATISGATTGGSLTYSGKIVPTEQSRVYKGSSI